MFLQTAPFLLPAGKATEGFASEVADYLGSRFAKGAAGAKVWKGTKIVNGTTVVDDVGAFGEHIAEDMLAENGWKNFTAIVSPEKYE